MYCQHPQNEILCSTIQEDEIKVPKYPPESCDADIVSILGPSCIGQEQCHLPGAIRKGDTAHTMWELQSVIPMGCHHSAGVGVHYQSCE